MNAAAFSSAPFRNVRLGPRETEIERRANFEIVLRSPHALGPYPSRLTEKLIHWANLAPDRIFIARRGPDGAWIKLSYATVLDKVRRIGQALLDRKLSPERPIAILSENGLEHALMALAAMHVGIPYAPVSPPYSLVSTDFGKLKYVLGLLTPGLVFVSHGEKYARAIAAATPADAEIVVVEARLAGRATTLFSSLEATTPTTAVDEAHARITPDTIGKILFTSGSTGMPKGVINTQRLMCSNLAMIFAALPFCADGPPVIVDWLPWNHTFGGNHNFGMMLYSGGTLYIDDGRPVPGPIKETVRNLREIAPTIFFNVPRGYEELIPFLRDDKALRETFFSRLSMMFYAGAGLSQPVWNALEELAVQTIGERVMIITGLGATETGPSSMFANWPGGRSGLLGLPVPGVELKLVPNEDKLEARFRGPNITPGYWRQPELNEKAFDAEGFYRIGDALKFVDPAKPEDGFLFDGRISEDFKLASGTWVSVGGMREKIIGGGAPLIQDAVITGLDRDFVGAIIFPRLDECRKLCPDLPATATQAEIVNHPAVRARFQELIDRLAKASTGSANLLRRLVIADAPPSLDLGEITDKGSINQRAVITHRGAVVEELYEKMPADKVVVAKL
ncbi:MAG TPA: feruloyl-CoA synthase [Magnetospirillaceae bacterium]|jgi:feruloyl-CoA synthase